MPKKGLLLINVGTPDAPEPGPVREYLREFLMDPHVIDVPWPVRWAFVHGLILPRRPAKSAEAYRKIWGERGSPLLFHSLDLAASVSRVLGPDWCVRVGMRYGRPSLATAIDELLGEGVESLVVFPLYPQFSLAATRSSLVETRRLLRKRRPALPVAEVAPFHASSEFLDAFAEQGRRSLAEFRFDHCLFSFHGLPERQVRKTDHTGSHCLSGEACCETPCEANRDCYRSQSYQTAAGIAARLGIAPGGYSVSFQSRLGRTPWIKPYTDVVLGQLVARGVRRLAVFCPAFVADCLETLEEVSIRAREQFIREGGEELILVPSLNSSEVWARGVAALGSAADSQLASR